MKPGTKPKPTAVHLAVGTFRADRHANRADIAPPNGEPAKPTDLDSIASALWDSVVPDLIRRKLVGEIDSWQLGCMCRWYSLYSRADSQLQADITDKLVRCAASDYWKNFDRLGAKYGLTAADLSALKTETPKSQGLSGRKRAQ